MFKIVHIDSTLAKRLAYYESGDQSAFGGILAPRGWYCFGTYGSNGFSLFVSPKPIDSSTLLSSESNSLVGPVVQFSFSSGDTVGRYAVAKTLARVFPAHREFVAEVIKEGVEPASSFPFGPYPKDQLTYKNDDIVEYQTPAKTDGLGTDWLLLKDDDPISGVVIVTKPDSDLLHLYVRLPPPQAILTASIIQQLENETANYSQNAPNSTNTNQEITSAAHSTRSNYPAKGFPVPEEMFVNAYVLANFGRDDLNQDQLVQLARDEYQMAKQMDTQAVLLGGEFLDTRGKRAMDYLSNLSPQQQSAPIKERNILK